MSKPPQTEMSPAGRFFVSRILPWMIVLVGSLTCYLGVEQIIGGRESVNWPHVEGTVLHSNVQTEESDRRSISYHAKVTYAYSVQGRSYENARVGFGDYGTGDTADAEEIVAKYPQSSTVTVFYNPNNPAEALLEPGLTTGAWLYIMIGLPFVLVGLAMAKFLPGLVNPTRRTTDGRVREPRAGPDRLAELERRAEETLDPEVMALYEKFKQPKD